MCHLNYNFTLIPWLCCFSSPLQWGFVESTLKGTHYYRHNLYWRTFSKVHDDLLLKKVYLVILVKSLLPSIFVSLKSAQILLISIVMNEGIIIQTFLRCVQHERLRFNLHFDAPHLHTKWSSSKWWFTQSSKADELLSELRNAYNLPLMKINCLTLIEVVVAVLVGLRLWFQDFQFDCNCGCCCLCSWAAVVI